MTATHFQDFVRDNGLPVTVEYVVDGHYTPDTYSPMFGAEGGDAPTFSILGAWPDTPWHHRLAGAHLRLRSERRTGLRATATLLAAAVDALMRLDEWWRARLTTAEQERFEAYLAEHYVEDPYDPEDDYR